MKKNSLIKMVAILLTFGIIMFAALPAFALSVTNYTKVARVTGATPSGETIPNPNHTDTNYLVLACDLGIMWPTGGNEIMAAFGDTYGVGWVGYGHGAGSDSPSADWSKQYNYDGY